MACELPPIGWYCTRPAGHGGPCAARPWSMLETDPLRPARFLWILFIAVLIAFALGVEAGWLAATDPHRPVLKTSGFENTRNFLISPARSGGCCAVPGGFSRQRLIAPPPGAIASIDATHASGFAN